MKQFVEKYDWTKVFKYWLITVVTIDIIWGLYNFFASTYYESVYFSDFFGYFAYTILGISIVITILNIIVSLTRKKYIELWYGVGIIFAAMITIVAMLNMVLANGYV